MPSVNELLQRRPVHVLIASGFGSGMSPVVPGTCGSLACTLVWYFSARSGFVDNFWEHLLVLALICAFGWWASAGILSLIDSGSSVAPISKKERDPGLIVIDEWAGMWITLLAADSGRPLSVVIAFVLFRLFDIVKPGPVRSLERLPGATGVMMDDIAAGALGAVVLWLARLCCGSIVAL